MKNGQINEVSRWLFLFLFFSFYTGCNPGTENDIYSVQYYVPPVFLESSKLEQPSQNGESPIDPFKKIPVRKSAKQICEEELDIKFDIPGSRIITMKLSFSGFILFHNEDAHQKVQKYLDEHHKGWHFHSSDEVPSSP